MQIVVSSVSIEDPMIIEDADDIPIVDSIFINEEGKNTGIYCIINQILIETNLNILQFFRSRRRRKSRRFYNS
jgi:hypothetical protein